MSRSWKAKLMALVTVFHKNGNKNPFQVPNLLSDFGGQLGLWMGLKSWNYYFSLAFSSADFQASV
jgi:hypothetical protein